MATTFITADVIDSGDLFSSDADGSDFVVARTALVGSTDGVAFRLTGDGHDLTILGTVHGVCGAALGDGPGGLGNRVAIAASGQVGGTFGIKMSGPGRIANNGEIAAETHGLLLTVGEAGGVGDVQVIGNRGVISGGSHGIHVVAGGTGVVQTVNRGSIEGVWSYFSSLDGDGVDRLTNRGEMNGHVVLGGGHDALANGGSIQGDVSLGTGNDGFGNRGGEVVGDVDLGAGADRFDARGGEVTGAIRGGDDDDTFLPGMGEETIAGGAGTDTLDFRASAGLRVSLSDDAGTREAAGDAYTGIERVLGSRGGADVIAGSWMGEGLAGLGGADSLSGEGGNDFLNGGLGADTLDGGAGNDVFLFASAAEGGDLVADFGAAPGNDDLFRLSAAGFGAGLAAGALAPSRFVSRADNLAQDADDRFVFRITDQTLWFDGNGSAAGALTLLADLQEGATVAAGDIVMV